MKKKFLCYLLSAAMVLSFTGCQKKLAEVPAEEQTNNSETLELTFNRQNFPIIDGSTSLVPLGQGIASVLLGESRENASDLITFNKTTQSFNNLLYGYCDIVIAAEPKSDVFDNMKEQGFEYEIETIAKEALVFVVNENNPVNSLTTEQIQDIYSGKITNWSQVGGNDQPIEAFQRNAGAGSQVMMEKLVMGDTKMIEPPTDHVETEMGGLIESVRSYDNSANAIGYTVYYYAADMKVADGLKIISVDAVLPTPDSIRSEAYPFINGYYCCIPATEKKDSYARKLYNWLISDAGQSLLTMEGYVSVYEKGKAPTSGDEIIVDYSAYVPYGSPEKKYTRIADGPLKSFKPSKKYGMVLPYCGSMQFSSSYSSVSLYDSSYGFFDINGELITDPVFDNIYLYTFPDKKTSVWVYSFTEDDRQKEGFVTLDGKTCVPHEYTSVTFFDNYILCENYGDQQTADVYDSNGKLVFSSDSFCINDKQLLLTTGSENYFVAKTPWVENEESEYYIFNKQLEVVSGPWSYAHPDSDNFIRVQDSSLEEYLLNKDLEKISIQNETGFRYVYVLSDYLATCSTFEGYNYLIDNKGNIIDSGADDYSCQNDVIISQTNAGNGVDITLFDSTGKLIAKGTYPCSDPDLIYIEYSGQGTIVYSDEYINDRSVTVLYDIATNNKLEIADSYIQQKQTLPNYPYITVYTYSPEFKSLVYDSELNLIRECPGKELQYNALNSDYYYISYNSYGFNGSTAIFNEEGNKKIITLDGDISVYGDYYISNSDFASTCYDKDGNIIFCYTQFGSASGD